MKMTIVLCFSQQRLIVLFHTFFGDNAADADKKTLPCSTVTYRKGGSNSKSTRSFCMQKIFSVLYAKGFGEGSKFLVFDGIYTG